MEEDTAVMEEEEVGEGEEAGTHPLGEVDPTPLLCVLYNV